MKFNNCTDTNVFFHPICLISGIEIKRNAEGLLEEFVAIEIIFFYEPFLRSICFLASVHGPTDVFDGVLLNAFTTFGEVLQQI